MQGQAIVVEQLLRLKANFPRTIMLVAPRGAGKKLLASKIAKLLAVPFSVPGNSVDEVRSVIDLAYKSNISTVYCFSDVDSMSAGAKNALLKVTEEPPKSSYFILTLEDTSAVPQTLISRSTVIPLMPYVYQDIKEILIKRGYAEEDLNKIYGQALTPGQAIEIIDGGVDEFISFCTKVLDSINTVTGTNALKISSYFKYKDTDKGYDPLIFLNTVSTLAYNRASDLLKTDERGAWLYASISLLTARTASDLKNKSIKKDSVIDLWVLAVRQLYKEQVE